MTAPHPDRHPPEEEDLLRQARRLDEAALTTLFDAFYQPLYIYLFTHLGHAPTAEDLAADVFRIFIEQVSRGRGPTRRLRPWLYRVAHNLMVDELRRRRHTEHDLLEEDLPARDPALPEQLQAHDEHRAVRLALRRLPPRQQIVLTMKYIQGMSNDQIARELHMKEGAVRALQFRGLRALARALERTAVTGKDLDTE